jgi:hypothetical protein
MNLVSLSLQSADDRLHDAAASGEMAHVQRVLDQGGVSQDGLNRAFIHAHSWGFDDLVEGLAPMISDPQINLNLAFNACATEGDVVKMRYRLGRGANARNTNDLPSRLAAAGGHVKALSFLGGLGVPLAKVFDERAVYVMKTAYQGAPEVFDYIRQLRFENSGRMAEGDNIIVQRIA